MCIKTVTYEYIPVNLCSQLGADTDILEGGARTNNRALSARKFLDHAHLYDHAHKTGRDRVKVAAERPVFDIFGEFL